MRTMQQSDSFNALSLKHFLSVIPEYWSIRQIDSSFHGVSVRIELLINEYPSGFHFTIWLQSLSESESIYYVNKDSYRDNLGILLNISTNWLNNLYKSPEINFIAIDIQPTTPSVNRIHFLLVNSYINNRLNLLLPNWRKLETVSIKFPNSNALHLPQGVDKMEVLAKYQIIKNSGIHHREQYMVFSSLLALYLQQCKTQDIDSILTLINSLSIIQNYQRRYNLDSTQNASSDSIDSLSLIKKVMPEIKLNERDSQKFQQQIKLFNQLSEYDKQKHSGLYNAIHQPSFVPY